MLAFEHIISVDRSSQTAIYQQIAAGMIDAIQQGILKPGFVLPGTRTLAKTLMVHRKTVISAYDELYAQSWIDISPRKGVMVSGVLPDLKSRSWTESTTFGEASTYFCKPTPTHEVVYPNRIVVNDGYPDIRLFPDQLITREYKFSLKQKALQSMEDPLLPWGAASLRVTLVEYLNKTRGISSQLEEIMITNGAQMGIFLAASTLLKTSDTVVVGEPGYPLANDVFEHLGAQIERINVDADGLDVVALEKLLQRKSVRCVYCIPHHHYPTTVTLSTSRRSKLLQLAKEYHFAIIEDDFDYDFQYDTSAYLPLYSQSKGVEIVYVGSFSKNLSPYLRIGFMISNRTLIKNSYRLRRLINIMGDEIMENTLATLINNGELSRHIKKSVKTYRERRDYLCDLLAAYLPGHINFTIPDGGMALWVKTKPGFNLTKAIQVGYGKGINLNGLVLNKHENQSGFRIGFASLTFEEIDDLVNLLKSCCS